MFCYNKSFKMMLEVSGLKNAAQLARLLCISPAALSVSKRKGEMSAKTIISFARHFDISIDMFIYDVTQHNDTSCDKYRHMEYRLNDEEAHYISLLLNILDLPLFVGQLLK